MFHLKRLEKCSTEKRQPVAQKQKLWRKTLQFDALYCLKIVERRICMPSLFGIWCLYQATLAYDVFKLSKTGRN